MFSISNKKAKADFENIKRLAATSLSKKQYSTTLDMAAYAANLAYHLNFRYVDDDLENLLRALSLELLGQSDCTPVCAKYVFYDDFGYDNRGLTKQYLHALDHAGVDYLYVVDSKGFDDIGSIAEQVRANPKATILKVPQRLHTIDKLGRVFDEIDRYCPEKAFLHLAPWSSSAVTLWNAFPKVERYLIDLTDHAFWLGKSCSDYFIGFREYGHNISVRERGIPKHKLLNLPYYPVVTKKPFAGFPEEASGRTTIFCGGAYYKIYGESEVFFKILQRIVDENPHIVILYAGSGNAKPLQGFITNNHLEGNILLLGNRQDIYEVFQHCDIYLNTYPLIGGLMSQYAVLNKKPLIGYSPPDIPCNFSEGLFSSSLHYKTTYTDLDQFHLAINLLISSAQHRAQATTYATDVLPTPELFSLAFADLVRQKCPASSHDIDIDTDRFSKIYFDMENGYLHKYHAFKFRHLGFRSFFHFPIMSILSLYVIARHNVGYFKNYLRGSKQ